MSKAMPIGDFTFLPEDEVALFDLDAKTKSDDNGYILEVDLKYPEHLPDSQSDYSLTAEKHVSIKIQRPKIIVERPIYLGFCVLEMSKITM